VCAAYSELGFAELAAGRLGRRLALAEEEPEYERYQSRADKRDGIAGRDHNLLPLP
jgi:hypothetical protein